MKPVDTKAGKEDGKGSDSQTNRTNSSDSATSSASRKQRKPFDRLLEGEFFFFLPKISCFFFTMQDAYTI